MSHAAMIDPIDYAQGKYPLPPAAIATPNPAAKRRGGPRKRVWTAERDAILRAKYAEARKRNPLQDLADELGVTLKQLYMRAYQLKLTVPRRW